MNGQAKQAGLTLIEIMIALLIGVFLIGGVLMIFINSKQTYGMQENLSRLQENGRFAMEFLTKDIRMAGYWDCLSPSSANDDVSGTEGASGTPDTITIRGAFVRPRAATDICGTPVIAVATAACPQTAVPANFYADNSSIISYSINGNNLRRTTNCSAVNVVEGVENMQILYGVDTDVAGTVNYGTPNFYAAANSPSVIANWANVVSIRIAVTVRSQASSLTKTGDGRLRHEFTSTIALRNRYH